MKFQYTVFVPSLDREIFILELTTGQQKELVKSLQGKQNFEFVQNTNTLLKEIIADPAIDITKLTLVDKMLILMRLRSISIGDIAEYEFKCVDCGKVLKTKIALSEIISKLNVLKFPFTSCQTDNLYIINCDLPTVKTELAFEETNKIDYDNTIIDYGEFFGNSFIHDLAFYVRGVLVPTQSSTEMIDINDMSYTERCEVLKRLPSKLVQKAWTDIKAMKKALSTPLLAVKCLCGKEIVNLKLDLNSPTYSGFLRSLFNENLHNIYQTIYYMVNVLHFPPQYVEAMIPGERTLYWGYYKEQKQRGKPENPQQQALDNLESSM